MKRVINCATIFILCYLGGFINAYSFYMRGGRYAFLQTGTLISIVYDLFSGNLSDLWLGLTTFISFYMGIALAVLLEFFFKKRRKEKYLRFFILIVSLILLLPSLFFEKTISIDWSFLSIFSVGIMGGILLEYFKDFTSTMMTNNTKLVVDSALDGILYNPSPAKRRPLFYLSLLSSFIIGVISFLLFYCYTSIARYSILLPIGFLSLLSVLELIHMTQPSFNYEIYSNCYIPDSYLSSDEEKILNHIVLYETHEIKKLYLDSKVLEAFLILKENDLPKIKKNELARKLYVYRMIEKNELKELKLFLKK